MKKVVFFNSFWKIGEFSQVEVRWIGCSWRRKSMSQVLSQEDIKLVF